jgi:DNA-binding NtrC family response regulator
LIAAKHRGYRKLLETWFRDHGFDVWATANGCEALEQHRAQRGKITVALLDVYMPLVDGSRTLASIRKVSPSLPCVLMCRDLNKRLEKKLLALGANAVFEKPLLLPDATAFIQDAMSTNARQNSAANETA